MEYVLIDYNNLRNAEMISFARIIIQHINKNANFTAPIPNAADFVNTIFDYETALSQMQVIKTGRR
jgi:hypothetical protein